MCADWEQNSACFEVIRTVITGQIYMLLITELCFQRKTKWNTRVFTFYGTPKTALVFLRDKVRYFQLMNMACDYMRIADGDRHWEQENLRLGILFARIYSTKVDLEEVAREVVLIFEKV